MQNIFSPSLNFISFKITSCCIVWINLEKKIKLFILSLLLVLYISILSIKIQLLSIVHTSNIFFNSKNLVLTASTLIILVQNREQYSSNISLYETLLYLLFITLMILALFSLKQLLLNKNTLSVSGLSKIRGLHGFNFFI